MADVIRLACTATVGEKGQIVIPKQMRDLFDIHPGDNILILADENRGIAIPPKMSLDEFSKSVFDSSGDQK